MATSLPPWLLPFQFGRTNALVSEEQKKEVHLYLQTAYDRLHDIRNRINKLQRQEEDLTTQIDRCKVAIAPHKHLPADVLRYTFALCLDEYTSFPLSENNVLLVLTQVCSAWRKIAHETSSFWCDIAVPEDHRFRPQKLQASLRFWAKCATDSPMSLKIYDDQDQAIAYPIKRREFKRFLISLLSWLNYHKLEISFDLKTLLELISNIPLDRLRQLETLSLIDTNRGLYDLGNLSFPPDTAFECLTSLKLKYVNLDLRSGYIQSVIPWKNIRRLALLQPLPPVVCLEVLQQTPVLEYCHMVPANDNVLSISELRAEVERVAVRLQHLRTLCISCIETRDLEMFMDQLVLPALEYVTCDAFHRVPEGILNVVVRFFRRSGTLKVKEVNIDDYPSGFQLQDLLRSMPHLRAIRFAESMFTFDDDTLERLSTGELGPCLNELEVGFVEDDDARITDMLRRRRECPRALNKEITPTFVLKY